MKKIKLSIGMALLSFSMLSAQFFENYQQAEEPQSSGFFENHSSTSVPEYEAAKLGGPGGPGDDPAAPIDDYLFLLPLLGIAIGGYYLRRKQEPIQN
ncbi:MAG TPA: hypothetical protein VL022_10155 [Moheibacter sp.]|nr:hypothetical protein [Moheibacter sp.]